MEVLQLWWVIRRLQLRRGLGAGRWCDGLRGGRLGIGGLRWGVVVVVVGGRRVGEGRRGEEGRVGRRRDRCLGGGSGGMYLLEGRARGR